MPYRLRVLCCILVAGGAGGAFAAGAPTPRPAQPGPLSELRIGGLAHDPWGPEAGSPSLSGEILLNKPFTPADLFTSYFVPRPHVGGSLNLGPKTSFAYTGLTWTFDLAPRLFVEGTLGGAIHTGETRDQFVAPGRAALGCSPLFRESGSVGVRLSANWSVMATVEHLSNNGLCSQDRGLTNIGARVGYSF
jgi:lipid A 3-O-deacylase